VPVLDPDQHSSRAGIPSSRHKVLEICPYSSVLPLVRRTATTEAQLLKGSIIVREKCRKNAAGILAGQPRFVLDDSKGFVPDRREQPSLSRAVRGESISEAGSRA